VIWTRIEKRPKPSACAPLQLARIRDGTTLAGMNRESEAAWLEFCAQQRGNFSAAAWIEYDGLPREEVAATALFLAGVEWFGHQPELLAVAAQLAPGAGFADLARRTAFDCSRFSNLLRRRHALAAS
jgi:hypothetical protein